MARNQEVRIGPWPGGINLLDEPDQISDDQCAWICNFDVENSGILSPRRSLLHAWKHAVDPTRPVYLLGSVVLNEPADVQSVLIGTDLGNGNTQVRVLNSPTYEVNSVTSELFTNLLPGLYKSIVQYQNKLWYIPANPASVGRFSISDPNNVLTSVSAMPYGDYGFILKDRMFVVRKANAELYFSKATDFTTWAAPDGGVIKINPGDNRPITKIVVLNNQIVIFKRNETYILTFNNNPTGDGTLRQISPDQGAFDAISYNNEIYCFNSRSVFKFVNGYFQDIATQLNILENSKLDRRHVEAGRLHIIGNTLILGINATPGAPVYRTFALNLNNGAWSIYEFSQLFNNAFRSASLSGRNRIDGSYLIFGDGTPNLYGMHVDKLLSIGRPDRSRTGENVAVLYEVFSKIFDFSDSQIWKRLYNWFADIQFPTTKRFGRLNYRVNPEGGLLINELRPTGAVEIEAADGLAGPTKSFRFKTVQFGYSGREPNPSQVTNVTVGPTVRYFKALIGVKSPLVSNSDTVN